MNTTAGLQNRLGTVPMDPGSVADDFDLALTFKSLPAWCKGRTARDDHALGATDRSGEALQRDCSGEQEKWATRFRPASGASTCGGMPQVPGSPSQTRQGSPVLALPCFQPA